MRGHGRQDPHARILENRIVARSYEVQLSHVSLISIGELKIERRICLQLQWDHYCCCWCRRLDNDVAQKTPVHIYK